jgi:hypothetical protein
MRLVYQPQKDVRIGEVVGLEALLRWKHPMRGEVSLAEFIPIAEDTGVILPIGEWVLRTACREAATWSQPLTVAVNVSAMQIHNEDFDRVVHEVLFETGLAPERLELEITETALMRDLNRALATLRRIKSSLGVRIAMDNFGTATRRSRICVPFHSTRSRSIAPSSRPWRWCVKVSCKKDQASGCADFASGCCRNNGYYTGSSESGSCSKIVSDGLPPG